jgi:hypothetical protein
MQRWIEPASLRQGMTTDTFTGSVATSPAARRVVSSTVLRGKRASSGLFESGNARSTRKSRVRAAMVANGLEGSAL